MAVVAVVDLVEVAVVAEDLEEWVEDEVASVQVWTGAVLLLVEDQALALVALVWAHGQVLVVGLLLMEALVVLILVVGMVAAQAHPGVQMEGVGVEVETGVIGGHLLGTELLCLLCRFQARDVHNLRVSSH